MEKIVLMSSVPDNISGKAMKVLKSFGHSNRGWKKVSGLSNFISYRLSRNYRILMSISGLVFIGNHDDYSLKIKILKKEGCQWKRLLKLKELFRFIIFCMYIYLWISPMEKTMVEKNKDSSGDIVALIDLIRELGFENPKLLSTWIRDVLETDHKLKREFLYKSKFQRDERYLIKSSAKTLVDNLCILKPYRNFFDKSDKSFKSLMNIKNIYEIGRASCRARV